MNSFGQVADARLSLVFLVCASLGCLVAARALNDHLLAVLLDMHQVLPVGHLLVLVVRLTLERASVYLIFRARVAL